MGKLRMLINSVKESQEKIVSKLLAEDCENQVEFKKLTFIKDAERELDYLEDLSKLYESSD